MLTTTILIADNHEIFRFGTAELLKTFIPHCKIYEAANFEQIKFLLEKHPIDLLILEIDISEGVSLQTIDSIRLDNKKVKILMHSALDERLYAVRYFNAGVNGYLGKTAGVAEFKNAVLTVLENKQYMSPRLKDHLLGSMVNLNDNQQNLFTQLSDREMEVASLLVKGMGSLEIAQSLNLHVASVSTYKNRILKKLNITTLVELIELLKLYRQ